MDDKMLLQVQNLHKYFHVNGVKGPGVQAVENVSFEIKKGETRYRKIIMTKNIFKPIPPL